MQRGTQAPPLPGSKEVLGMIEKPKYVAEDYMESLRFHPTVPSPPL